MHERQRTGQVISRYETPASVEAALTRLQSHGTRARLIAGGTDLMLELFRRQRPGVDTLIDIGRIPGLAEIREAPDGKFRIGALVTHAQIVKSKAMVRDALPLAQACLEVGSPQVRNCGTLAGALVTAHPGADVTPVLIALGAEVELRSAHAARKISVADLLDSGGPAPGEMLVEIIAPALTASERGIFVKSRARRGQAVAIANLALILRLGSEGAVERARVICGGVRPVPFESTAAATALSGAPLTRASIAAACDRVRQDLAVDDDPSPDADYRKRVLTVMVRRGLAALEAGRERDRWPLEPVTLSGVQREAARPRADDGSFDGAGRAPIEAWVNGRAVAAPAPDRFTLLAWLREALGLTGTKDGCSEGVCGACTVELDGKAVLACLLPAARVQGASIRTVEGLGKGDELHRLQQAFIDQGASQCGFCTPGFLMAGAALLGERPSPDDVAVEDAFSGNLCRCTGYHAIRRAMAQAARQDAADSDGHR